MKSLDLSTLTIATAQKRFADGSLTPRQLVDAYRAKIAEQNSALNAYLEAFDEAYVYAAADEAEKRIKAGQGGPLTGIPFAIKDNILVKGRIASAASRALEHYHAPYDATAITRLKEAGAIFLGRTNMDEFAMGGSTENSAFGVTHNPHDPTRVAGGSSGGSAAAVAMHGALVALGTDTGGSVRQPASFCGLVGLKPTYGAVSRHGIMAMGSSLDQIGTFTKTVEEAETIFNAIAGQDVLDGTTYAPGTYTPKKVGTKKPIIGVPRAFVEHEGVDPAVIEATKKTLAHLAAAGYDIVDIDLPSLEHTLAVYYVIMPAEVSANMARFDGIRYGFREQGKTLVDDYSLSRGKGLGREVRRRILLGTYILSSGYYDAYYAKALALRRRMADDFTKAFEKVDIIFTPTAPSPAFTIGSKTADPVTMYLADIFTVTANLVGVPALSVPAVGTSSTMAPIQGSLPIGVQLTARHGDEKTLFAVGHDIMGA
jgi:aspartyl-tRNA(Asn)/glutamyl-tRNA(Gln) amidotransferase subunit A